MTDTIGPFDGSAPWSQSQWYRFAEQWTGTGVLGTPASSTSSGGLPFSSGALTVSIGDGRSWVRGGGFERSGGGPALSVTANANGSLYRRDRVVLRRDLSAKTIAPVLIAGTPSATPTAPALQRVDAGQFDEPLYSFLVPPNSGTALSGVIDERAWLDPNAAAPLAVYDSNGRAALADVATEALEVYESKTDRLFRWDGTQWALESWLGNDRSFTGLPGIGLSYTAAVIGHNTPTVIGGWPAVSGPPANHADLLSYVSATSIKCLVPGRVRATAYAFSDTPNVGMSQLTLNGPSVGLFGSLVDRRHRSGSSYSGAGTLEQTVDAIIEVQPNDLIGMTVFQFNAASASVSYNLLLQVHYL